MKVRENLVVYKNRRRVSIDGKYYIIEKDIPDPEHKRPAVHLEGGERYFTDCFLYDALGNQIISGEEIFDDEEKKQLAGIQLRFIGPNTFIAFGVGWRENMMFYVYRISDNRPKRLYRVHGGDCSFIFLPEKRPITAISQDGLISVGFEYTGRYDKPELVGERYMVLRLEHEIIKKYPVGFEGKVHPLNNKKWLEVGYSQISLYLAGGWRCNMWGWWDGDKYIRPAYETLSACSISPLGFLLQDDFLTTVWSGLLIIYNKKAFHHQKIEKRKVVLGKDDAFYIDPSDISVVRIEGVKRKDVSSIETSPGGQYVVVETKQGTFVYEYNRKELLNRQAIDPKHSFCFKQE